MYRVLTLWPRESAGKAVRRLRYRLAVGVQKSDDDGREEELYEQQSETAHLSDEPEDEPAGEGREVRGQLFRSRGCKLLPPRREPRADDREGGHPCGELGDGEGFEGLRPVGDPSGASHDGRDPEVERHQQDQQQGAGHDRGGKRTPTAEPRLRAQQERPRRDRDHDGPDRRHQERAHDPEATDDQRSECQQLQSRAGEVQRPVGLHAPHRAWAEWSLRARVRAGNLAIARQPCMSRRRPFGSSARAGNQRPGNGARERDARRAVPEPRGDRRAGEAGPSRVARRSNLAPAIPPRAACTRRDSSGTRKAPVPDAAPGAPTHGLPPASRGVASRAPSARGGGPAYHPCASARALR